MTCVSHACAETAAVPTSNDTARLKALALATLVAHGARPTLPVDDLVAAAADLAPAPTLSRT